MWWRWIRGRRLGNKQLLEYHPFLPQIAPSTNSSAWRVRIKTPCCKVTNSERRRFLPGMRVAQSFSLAHLLHLNTQHLQVQSIPRLDLGTSRPGNPVSPCSPPIRTGLSFLINQTASLEFSVFTHVCLSSKLQNCTVLSHLLPRILSQGFFSSRLKLSFSSPVYFRFGCTSMSG